MKEKLNKILKHNFKLESFKKWQLDVITNVCSWKDTLVFMPTWGWKSLTYQLSGLYREWLTLVISPLISLMKDQVDKLNHLWIKTKLINSTINKFDIQIILNELSKPNTDIKFLYIAPERLNSFEFLRVMSNVKLWLVAIDEAHCISAWWHDFRPSYMKIKKFLDELKKTQQFPIIALTATATKKVRKDIVLRLWLTDYSSFTSWFDRKNIKIIIREISKKEEKIEKVLEIIEKTLWSWIIYCASRKAVKEVYDTLISKWIKAWIYTWAMTPEKREVEQDSFMVDDYKVIVATNAFGMWIDKKDIRFIIHYNLPWSIENYYQEIWRAWRDNKSSFAVVIASFGDTKIQEFFIDNTYPSKEEILQLYDYLYYWEYEWFWKWKVFLKTQKTIAKEAKINSDMKVWSALRILEKYNIIKKWVDEWNMEEWFRGRGLTLIQKKRKHSHILIDWKHQELLKEEAYFKLEQIKKLLFYPSCRKRFILNYFSDEKDLATLWDNCSKCDFCIERKNFNSMEIEDYVNTSVFALVLDVVKKIDEKIWVVMMTKFLWGSKDTKIIEWWMDKRENFWILWDLTSQLISAVIESLINTGYLHKTFWKYPLLWITDTWKIAINRNDFLKDDNKELQNFIRIKLWTSFSKNKKTKISTKKEKSPKWETLTTTLDLFNDWKTINEIVKLREFKKQTIESHIIKLYLSWKIPLNKIMDLSVFSNLKFIKKILTEFFKTWYEQLKEIKDKCSTEWWKVSYFDINLCIAMIEKGDL